MLPIERLYVSIKCSVLEPREYGKDTMKFDRLIRDLPDEEKPYEKCLEKGASALTSRELVAILLRTGSRGSSVLQLADRLLTEKEGYSGLSALCHYDLPELLKLPGIGEKKAVVLLAVVEMARRLSQDRSGLPKINFSSPQDIVRHYSFELGGLEQERVLCLFLNTKNHLITEKVISIGSVNYTVIPPREIFMMAFKVGAVHLILLHNHPSGDATPSAEDRLVTERIARLGVELGIRLQDHIIIGSGGYYSFAAEGLLS